MKRSAIVTVAMLLATSSTLAYGVARSGQWSGMVMGNGTSKIHGTATMKAGKDAGSTEVMVSYTGDTPNTTRPWHVHMGTCASAGGILGGARPYTPLLGDARGAAESKAILPVALPENGSYYVNIHESSAAMATIVACGDLKHDK